MAHKISSTVYKPFVKLIVEHLSSEFDIEVGCYFRNQKKTCCRRTRKADSGMPGKYDIIVGYETIEWHMERYHEYPSIAHLIRGIRGRVVSGMESAYWLTIHEFSHVLQVENNQRFYGDVHNSYFVDWMNELAEFFTFEDAEELAREKQLPGYRTGQVVESPEQEQSKFVFTMLDLGALDEPKPSNRSWSKFEKNFPVPDAWDLEYGYA